MNCNMVLRDITRQIYNDRKAMPCNQRTNYRIERVNGGLLCDLWFLTTGCIHDRAGGCTMCNYGKTVGKIEQDRIIDELRNIMTHLPFEFEDFLLTPSGSMLDEREVPPEMRDALVHLLKGLRTKRFIVESRVDTITPSSLNFMRTILPETEKYIEIGVESSNDWVSKYCINKNATYSQFQNAAKLIHEYGIHVTANVGIGAPFLSERAAIYDSIQSIRDVMRDGADSVVVFPYHIKSGTLLEVLHQQGLYQCVSLWALIKVLSSFTSDELSNIQISWYKDYYGSEHSNIMYSPDTCPNCHDKVLNLLDKFRDTQSPETLKELNSISCACRMQWEKKIQNESNTVELDRVKAQYIKIADQYSIRRDCVEKELKVMQSEWDESMKTKFSLSYELERIDSFIKEYVFDDDQVAIPVSGGLDSDVVARLCHRSLGSQRIKLFIVVQSDMEEKFLVNARNLANSLGLHLAEIHLENANQELVSALEEAESGVFKKASALDTGKAKCSVRSSVISSYQDKGFIIAGTGNRTEKELGFFLPFGDNLGHFKPIAHLYKTEVIALAHMLGTSEDVIRQEPSAGFWSGQTDLEDFSYWIINEGPIVFPRDFSDEEVKLAEEIQSELSYEKIDLFLKSYSVEHDLEKNARDSGLSQRISHGLAQIVEKSKRLKNREIFTELRRDV